MQNKLKRSKKSEHVLRPAEVRTSSCLGDGTSPGGGTAAAAGASCRKAPPKDVKIAPIFLLKTPHGKTKRRREGRPDRPVEKPQESVRFPRAPLVRSETESVNISCRGQLSPSAVHICLEEIQTANPAFPVGTVFSTLQKNTGEKLQDFGTTETKRSPQNDLQEKRKQGSDGPERQPKRLRCSPTAEEPFGVARCHSSAGLETSICNKLGRAHRLRRSGDPAGREPSSGPMNHPELKTCGLPQTDSSSEDVLWTDKYSPRHSSEVIGNSASVDKLRIWLKKWKLRADCDERRKMSERKQEENSNHSWDCGDFQGEAGPEDVDAGEAAPCSTALITGPAGVGKTASVYACAQELGFKVFEVNCSSQRSGRHVLAQLKEATQSHLVEVSGKDPLTPTYFNNYAASGCPPKSETFPGKTVRPKIATMTSRNRAAKRFGGCSRSGKTTAPAATLADYFKKKAKADRAHFGGPKTDGEEPDGLRPGCGQTVPKNRKTAMSLILFEEVDVIFDDDVGFLTAIKTFMTTTKRPVVLTTSDPLFRERFNCSLEEMLFKTPSAVNVCSYLRLVALAEGVRLESDDAHGLVGLFGVDVRRCLLQLQLWVLGGGASPEEPSRVRHPSVAGRGDDSGDPGCTASSLGLHRVTQRQLLNLLMLQVWAETDMKELLGLLAESWRGHVPLLYSNLELLLPIEAGGKNTSRLGKRKRVPATSARASSPLPPEKVTGSGDETEANAGKAVTGRLEALADFFDLMSYLDSTTGPRCPEAFVWTGAGVTDGSLDEMSEDNDEVGGTWRREGLLEIRAAVEGLGCHRCCWRMSEVSTKAAKCRQEVGDARPASSKRQSLTFGGGAPCAPSVRRRRFGLSRKILGSASFGLLGSRRAVAVDYMPVLRHICRLQSAQEQKEPSRCLRYLSSTQLGLSRSTIQLLAEDFSSTT
uniref:ATPase family AAA domain-containing protein 5b isoform X2 n=1 Tax=Gasterosteus aculeatus aculeatus TaxID=481459 RepID=UPI001A98B6A8|nr:ATPase family AAA domain-containing protein 5b isoform X2 [Gasterosteus aculeatus aculeatus]